METGEPKKCSCFNVLRSSFYSWAPCYDNLLSNKSTTDFLYLNNIVDAREVFRGSINSQILLMFLQAGEAGVVYSCTALGWNETKRNRTLVSLLSIMPWERFCHGKLEDSDPGDF